MRDYTKIIAWQKADDMTVAVYSASRSFPREEVYALTSQLRRAAYSVPANIVEGATRDSKKDYLHFLYIARGSLAEARYFVHLAHRLEYLSEAERNQLLAHTDETFRTLAGLIKAVELETGRIPRTVARMTSAFVLSLSSLIVRFGV
jgi:four helix bundle protein